MEIITKNGKNYLSTFVAKIDNEQIDAGKFFLDVREATEKIIADYNRKYQKNYTFLDKSMYGYSLQALLNRFCGSYFSPSFIKGYMTNPALHVVANCFEEDVNDSTAIGTTFHKIMEIYYSLPPEERNREKLIDITKQTLTEGQDEERMLDLVCGYMVSKDYKGGEMDDTTLTCDVEKYGKAKYITKTFDGVTKTLPCDISYVADRLDYRDDGVYIIDYKTGRPRTDSATFDGYLGSMILYKWGIEQELGVDVKGAYLMFPSGNHNEKWCEMDFSEQNQKEMFERVEACHKQLLADNRSRRYRYTDKGYFNTEDAKAFRNIMNDSSIRMAKLPMLLYIGESKDAY